MDLPNVEDVAKLLQLLTPGIIITAIRTRAVSGLAPELKDKILEFGAIAIVYGATAGIVFHIKDGVKIDKEVWLLLHSIIVPMLVGIFLAYISAYKLLYRIADAIKLPIAHHLPTAWDYTFESLPTDTFILITLNDGTTIPGKMAKNSFASSNKEERDLLIEELWEIASSGQWTQVTPIRSTLVCGKDIRLVEVF